MSQGRHVNPEELIRLGMPELVARGFAGRGPFRALVDRSYYAAQGKGGRQRPLAHYLREGDAAMRDPSPYFDVAYYKSQNPDWRDGGSALGHYLLRHLAGDERAAHPFFDPAHYAQAYPDIAEAGAATLLHFAKFGDAERRSPSIDFDAAFYASCYLPLEARRPFAHYINKGRELGYLPRPRPRPPGSLRSALHSPVGDRPVLLVGHDAQRAGAPYLMRDIASGLSARGWSLVFILQRGGPLVPDYEELGPVALLAEGWPQADLSTLLPGAPALSGTVVTAPLLPDLCADGRRVFLLVQEMQGYWQAQGLSGALIAGVQAGAVPVFSFPIMQEAFAEELRAAGIDDARTITRAPGLPAPQISCAAHLAQRRAWRGRGPVIIGAGYADYRKGFDRFLKVALKFSEARPDAQFVWLGELSEWARRQLRAADGLSLHLPGFREDAIAWYGAADLFLLTSRQDPGPTVLCDALLQGTPFVGFDSDIGLRDLMAPFGIFVPDDDLDACVSALHKTLAADIPALRRMRRRGVHAISSFDHYLDDVERWLTE